MTGERKSKKKVPRGDLDRNRENREIGGKQERAVIKSSFTISTKSVLYIAFHTFLRVIKTSMWFFLQRLLVFTVSSVNAPKPYKLHPGIPCVYSFASQSMADSDRYER